MKKWVLCVIPALILAGCGNWENENVESVAAVSAVSAVASSSSKLPSEIPSEKKGWNYSKVKDEMRNRTIYIAGVQSENKIDIGGPYGSVGLELSFTMIDNDQFPIAQFTLSDGQFDVCRPEACKISYRLENDMIMTIEGMQTGSANIVGCSEGLMEAHGGADGCMLQNLALYQPIINGAKRLIVEVDIFGYGGAQFKFDVSGLQSWEKWDSLAVLEVH